MDMHNAMSISFIFQKQIASRFTKIGEKFNSIPFSVYAGRMEKEKGVWLFLCSDH